MTRYLRWGAIWMFGGLVSTASASPFGFGSATSPAPAGFLLPTGGGSETKPLPTRIAIYRAGIQKLDQNIRKGALGIGNALCVIENSASATPEESKSYFDNFKALLPSIGIAESRFASFVVNTPSLARDASIAAKIKKTCGLIHTPGGDQTATRGLWDRTPMLEALKWVIQNGGGLSGSSAGAAILGSLAYFPGSSKTSEETESSWFNTPATDAREFQLGFITSVLPGIPRYYLETHTEQRERVARALAVIATWETKFKSRYDKTTTLGITLDVDTAALISFDADVQGYTAEIVGGRSVEFLFPTSKSQLALASNRYPYYTNVKSHLLFSGGKVVISGQKAGEVLADSSQTVVAYSSAYGSPSQECLNRIPDKIYGDSERSLTDASELGFTVAIRDLDGKLVRSSGGSERRIGITENFVESSSNIDSMKFYSYLTGDMQMDSANGCGFWMPYSFSLDDGQRANRLAAERYVLGLGKSLFSVALPKEISAEKVQKAPGLGSEMKFVAAGSDRGSSLLIYDARTAQKIGVSTYVYQDYTPLGPLQTGTWQGATVHLLPPGSYFDPLTGKVRIK